MFLDKYQYFLMIAKYTVIYLFFPVYIFLNFISNFILQNVYV